MVNWEILRYRADGQDFEFSVGKGMTIHAMDELGNKRVLGVADEAQRRSIAWDNNVDQAHIGYVNCPRDMIVYPKGNTEEFAIVLDSKNLQAINKNTKLNLGSIILQDGQREFEGNFSRWFRKKDLIINRQLTFDEYMDHEGWGTLLYDPRIEGIHEELATHPNFKEHYGRQVWNKLNRNVKKDTAMGFYVSEDTFKDFTGGRLFCLFGTDNNSDIISSFNGFLGHGGGRLIGVAPQAQATLKWAPKNQLEASLKQNSAYFLR